LLAWRVMVSRWRVPRSVPLGLVVAAAVVAGCSARDATTLTTTAIVRLPSGFHEARLLDDRTIRAVAVQRPGSTEFADPRSEGVLRRESVAEAAGSVDDQATGGFVCQIDMTGSSSD
jgi:hypothetical protein